MKSLGNFPDPFAAEIAGQPEAVRRAAAAALQQVDAIVQATADLGGGLVLSGMGSSYDACYPAVTALATAGVRVSMVGAAELLHFRLPMVREDDTVVLVSQSGESAEVVRVAERLAERRARVVAVTNGTANTLAATAGVALDTRAGAETGPSTMTFAAALVLLAGLARTAAAARDGAGGRAVTRVLEALVAEADMAAMAIQLLVDDLDLPDRLAAWHERRSGTVVLGRGAARAAAEMSALTLKEAVGLPVESLETAQFRHGPLELAGPGLAAIVLATEIETEALDLRLARELATLGSAVLTVTARGTAASEASRARTIDVGPLDRLLAPAAAVVPAQLLAWRLAQDLDRVPGSYVHAAKVTTRE